MAGRELPDMAGTAAAERLVPAGDSARILVVDDERSMREMLAILLRREGHDVAVAENGQTAIDLLNRQPFDLVVSDARMPDLDGLEVLRHARSINPSVIAIMITAYGSPDLIRGVAQLGVNDYVEKPFNTEVLRFRIRKELDRKRLQQENVLL
jgi:two-component system response regulator PilR (NtrC family)